MTGSEPGRSVALDIRAGFAFFETTLTVEIELGCLYRGGRELALQYCSFVLQAGPLRGLVLPCHSAVS